MERKRLEVLTSARQRKFMVLAHSPTFKRVVETQCEWKKIPPQLSNKFDDYVDPENKPINRVIKYVGMDGTDEIMAVYLWPRRLE